MQAPPGHRGVSTYADAEADGERFRAQVSPEKTHTYHFLLEDQVGLENRNPVRFSIRVLVDEPPRARMKLPGVGDMITDQAVLPFELEFADTYGLATAELAGRVGEPCCDEEEEEAASASLPSASSAFDHPAHPASSVEPGVSYYGVVVLSGGQGEKRAGGGVCTLLEDRACNIQITIASNPLT